MTIEELSHELIRFGIKEEMQDLYVHPNDDSCVLRFRRGAEVVEHSKISVDEAQKLIARFKYLGEMDVGERRKVQLGAITYPIEGQTQRLRLSTVGDYRLRESLVVRFLHQMADRKLNFFLPEQFATVENHTRKSGLYLFAGPTGSGKTTLMYHLARQEEGQVITIEDPVEIEETRFLQLQTNDKIGQTYDRLIQLSLRHRPDVLIVGEIRDRETAAAAIRAALTGHKVFATIHARGVMATLARIRDFVGSDQELDNCLSGIIYQRLLPDQNDSVAALLAYRFGFPESKAACRWQESLQTIYQRRQIDEITYQKEN